MPKHLLTCFRLNLFENIRWQYWHILGCLDFHDGPSSAAICSGVVLDDTGSNPSGDETASSPLPAPPPPPPPPPNSNPMSSPGARFTNI
jgi:hypothetical protein